MVAASSEVATSLLDTASRHVASARQIREEGDLAGAYQLAYDALRKSAAALLALPGLRATDSGGHIAVQDAAIAQFGTTITPFRCYGRVRRYRNRFEYPADLADEPADDDLDDAIDLASKAVERSRIVLEEGILDVWER